VHLPWESRAPGDGPAISTSVTAAESAELARLAPGQAILEVGSAYGYSACVMALAGAESVLAVDPHTWIPGSHHAMLENLAAYRVADRVEVIAEMSFQALPWLEREGARFGLAFVDGDHAEHAVRHDVEWALKLLEPTMTLVLGAILALILFSVLTPIYDLLGKLKF
jgi:predicted O-methyltransferase YrrM